jgi:hypothetical protein
MKRLLGILIALAAIAFIAPPALADDSRGDRLCTGGTTLVGAEDTPNSVLLFGCGARIQSGAQVRRDVVSFGGDVVIEDKAKIGGDTVIFGGNLQIAGATGRDIVLFGGTVTLEPTAVVGRNIILMGGTLDKKEGAVVKGKVENNSDVTAPSVRVNPPSSFNPSGWSFFASMIAGFFKSLFATISLAVLGALIIVFLPTQLKQVADTAEKSAAPSLGIGCLTWIVVPPLMILFIITCLGIPVSVVLGIALVAAVTLGWIAISLIIGERLLKALKAKNIVPLLSVVAGLFALWLVTMVPVLGWLIGLFAGTLALGAVVLTRFGTRAYPTLSPSVPAPVASTESTSPPNESGPTI